MRQCQCWRGGWRSWLFVCVAITVAITLPITLPVATGAAQTDGAAIGGVVLPVRQSKLSFSVPGRLIEVPVLGKRFDVGQVVARLDNTAMRVRLDKARAARETARLGLVAAENSRAKVERLVRERIVSPVASEDAALTVEQAKAAVASSQASLDEAQLSDDGSVLQAPFRGVVIAIDAQAQEWVGQGQPVLTLADLDRLELAIDVEPTVAATIRAGVEANLFVGTTRVGRARAARVMPFTDPASGLTRAVWTVVAETRQLVGRYVTLSDWAEGATR